jgi:hypothetical protein
MIISNTMPSTKKLTYDHVKKLIKSKGWAMLSKTYINHRSKVEYLCSHNIVHTQTLGALKKKKECCKFKTFEYVYQFCQQKNWTLLTPKSEYKNSKQKLQLVCEAGHRCDKRFENVSIGIDCAVCKKNNPYTYAQVCEKIKSINWTILTTEEEYKNSKQTLRLICDKNHKADKIFTDIQTGKRCRICSGSAKYLYDDVKKYIESNEHILNSDTYVGMHSLLSLTCPNNHIFNITFSHFQNNVRCAQCVYFRSEEDCRKIFEQYFSSPFPKQRPLWLKQPNNRVLELDGYNEQLGIGFEYNGIQHYEITPYYHRNGEADLVRQQTRDAFKRQKCIENGVKLIEIPYTVSYLNVPKLREYIIGELDKLGNKK